MTDIEYNDIDFRMRDDPEEPERCRHCGAELPDERHQELAACPQQHAEELSDRAWEGHRERQLENLGVDPDQI